MTTQTTTPVETTHCPPWANCAPHSVGHPDHRAHFSRTLRQETLELEKGTGTPEGYDYDPATLDVYLQQDIEDIEVTVGVDVNDSTRLTLTLAEADTLRANLEHLVLAARVTVSA